MERNVKQKSVCCRKDSETVSVDISSYGCERVSSLRYRCGRKTVLPSEETRWVWVFRAVVVDEDAIRKNMFTAETINCFCGKRRMILMKLEVIRKYDGYFL